MNIVIRHEEEKDYFAVANVTREAFWNLYKQGCEEHLVVNKIRNHKDYLPTLSFVIEVDGEIAGSIFYTKSKIQSNDGTEHETITFGPVSILPKYHKMGLGKQLIEHSINVAKQEGHKAILTLGYPHHYTPYGFVGGKKHNICMGDGNYYIGLLVLPLYENALQSISGVACFSDVFEVSEEEVEQFDKKFDFKEKRFQQSQKDFEVACSTLDTN